MILKAIEFFLFFLERQCSSQYSFFSFILVFTNFYYKSLPPKKHNFNAITCFQLPMRINPGGITCSFDFACVIANDTELTKKKATSRNRQARHLTESITGRKMSRRLSFFLSFFLRRKRTRQSYVRQRPIDVALTDEIPLMKRTLLRLA